MKILNKKCFTFVLMALSLNAFAAKVDFSVDPGQSRIEWVGKKVTGEHNGLVTVKSGKVTFDGQTLTGGELEIDMTSITCLDLTDPKWNGKLVGHLKSDDFFSVDKHKTAKLVVKKVDALKSNEFKVTADVTIKGITKPADFVIKASSDAKGFKAEGTVVLDRSKWDVKYNSKSFFDAKALGDKLIYDDFELKVNLVGKTQ